MTVQIQPLQASKTGNKPEECQDAVGWDEKAGTYAIADGVSDSAFQRLWARLLVDTFVKQAREGVDLSEKWIAAWLESAQQSWQNQVEDRASMSWHGQMKSKLTGGEATFLGIRLAADRRAWNGFLIGDCNLFRFNQEQEIVESVPIQSSTEFSNITQAFSSINKNTADTLGQVKWIHGRLEPGDTLVLATDAMARWILEQLEANQDPLRQIPVSGEPGVFNQWVSVQRKNASIKDDDTSLLMIQVDPGIELRTPKKAREGPASTRKEQQVPAPLPAPLPVPQARPARRGLSRLSVTVFMLAMLGFFILGAAAQKELMSNRLQRNAHTPLLEVVRKIDAGEFRTISVSMDKDIQQIREEIIKSIIAMRPETSIRDLAECLLKQPYAECSPVTEESSK